MNILITGATSGIGYALTLQYAELGHQVYAIGRNQQKLNQLAEQSDFIEPLSCDLTDKDAVLNTVSFLPESLDIVVLNAGGCDYLDVDEFDSQLFVNMANQNWLSVVYSIEAWLHLLKQSELKVLALMGSLASEFPFTKAQAYGGSKAAVEYLAKSLKVDLAGQVDVRLISPGFVKTPLTDKNDFDMPMQITAQEAATAIIKGLASAKFNIRFPSFFAFFIKCLASLPLTWQFALSNRMKQK